MNCLSQYIKIVPPKRSQKNPSSRFDAKHFLKYYPSIFLHKYKLIRGLNQRPTQRTDLLSRSCSLSFLRQKWQTVHSGRSTPFLTCFCMTYTTKPWHASISHNSTYLDLLKLFTSQIPYNRHKAGIWGEEQGNYATTTPSDPQFHLKLTSCSHPSDPNTSNVCSLAQRS